MNVLKVYSPGILNELINKTILFHNALLEKKEVDEKIIVEIFKDTDNDMRQIIRRNYKQIFKHPIQNDISYKLKDNNKLLNDIIINMFDTPYEFDAKELNKALSTTIGKKEEDIIIEIFVSRSKSHLNIIDLAYKKFYEISLREEIQNKLPQISKYLLVLMENERPLEQTIKKEDAYKINEEINKKGINSCFKDIDLFKKILVEKSRKDLILISRAYNELNKKNLYDDFIEENNENENNMKLIKVLYFAVITPAQYFAKKCSDALRSNPSDINTLIRVLISRSNIDIKAIRDYYYKETKNNIKKDINKDNNCNKIVSIGKILKNILG